MPWYVLAAQKASEAEEDAEYIAGILPVLEPQISDATAINNTLINTTIPAAAINGTLTDTIIPAAEAAEESLQALIDSTPTIQEIIDARDGSTTLGVRLDDIDAQVTSLASGSPKGVYATSALLEADTNANTVEGKRVYM